MLSFLLPTNTRQIHRGRLPRLNQPFAYHICIIRRLPSPSTKGKARAKLPSYIMGLTAPLFYRAPSEANHLPLVSRLPSSFRTSRLKSTYSNIFLLLSALSFLFTRNSHYTTHQKHLSLSTTRHGRR